MEVLSQPEYVNFLVGGMAYCLRMADIRKHPDSYFSTAVQEARPLEEGSFIKIDRAGGLFRFISEFLITGRLALSSSRLTVIELQQIQAEASFYRIPDLVQACEDYIIKEIRQCTQYKGKTTCVYASEKPTDLVNVLGAVWAPFCIVGSFCDRMRSPSKPLFKSSTLGTLNITELIEEAQQSPFGKGTETLIDTSVRNSFEIPASKLNPDALASFSPWMFQFPSFAPRMEVEMRPYKLVIYQEGGFFSEHRDSVRGENHIGTLVYILNSAFTGGKLIVRQNDQEVYIDSPNEWLAMYGDCPHRIEPVTSGTRVSLIFDLYQVGPLLKRRFFYPEENRLPLLDIGAEHALDAGARAAVYTALDEELASADNVVICLAHLYPVCQADPNCLKGGDASLYSLLFEANKYDLSVIPIVIEQGIDHNYRSDSVLSGGIIDLNFDLCAPTYNSSPPSKRTKLITKLIIPVNRNTDEVLHHSEYIDHVGNQAQNEELHYLTTGLRVVRKMAVDVNVGADVGESMENVGVQV